MNLAFPRQSCWPTTVTVPPNKGNSPMNDDVGDGRSEGSARHDGEGNNNDRHDGGNGWMDAPPDPSPGIIPGPEVDTEVGS